jgi:hypothetical protein
MKPALTEEQIERVRTWRAEGATYQTIHERLGLTGTIAPSSLRYHCADLPAKKRDRQMGEVKAKNGKVIRYFTEAEDERLIEWHGKPEADRPALFALARELGRKRVSLGARLTTLKRQGRL